MEWLSNWLVPSKNLSCHVTRESLTQFFERGRKELFESTEFKSHLRQSFESGKDVQVIINQAQLQLFESLGVQGQAGMQFLGKIRAVYANDSQMLRNFYQ
jgi:hypothetical protein